MGLIHAEVGFPQGPPMERLGGTSLMGARQGPPHCCVLQWRAASLGFKAFTQQEVGVSGWVVERVGGVSAC